MSEAPRCCFDAVKCWLCTQVQKHTTHQMIPLHMMDEATKQRVSIRMMTRSQRDSLLVLHAA